MGELLTVKEVAARCRIGQATLYRLLARGDGPECLRIGGRRFVATTALETWLESCRERQATT